MNLEDYYGMLDKNVAEKKVTATPNQVLMTMVAAEFAMPALTQDHEPAVALYGKGWREEFCIPVKTEEDAKQLARRLQELFIACMERYETLKY